MMHAGSTRNSAMLDVFDTMADRIRSVTNDRPILFFVNPGNWGDSLIREGAERFFCHYGLSYRTIRFKDILKGRSRLDDEISACAHPAPVMIYNGSGAFTKHYNLIEYIAELSHRFDTSIFLPSTYALDVAQYNFSKGSIFFARDRFESQAFVPQAQFCHDMAFFLEPESRAPGAGELWCLRRDKEMPDGSELPVCNVDLSRKGRAHTPVRALFDRLSRAETIYTNRLHIGIAGALLGRNVHLYTNDYFKIRAIYHSSIEPNFKNVRFDPNVPSFPGPTQRWYHRLLYR